MVIGDHSRGIWEHDPLRHRLLYSSSILFQRSLTGTIVKQGYVALAGEDLMYPSIGVNSAGKGVMTFSLGGPDFFPSAAYVSINAVSGAGDIHIGASGAGPEDGFHWIQVLFAEVVLQGGETIPLQSLRRTGRYGHRSSIFQTFHVSH